MTFYFPNPKVWSPPESGRILAVLAPEIMTEISEEWYLSLLSQRVNWLICQWMETQLASQAETHQMLIEILSELEPNQSLGWVTDGKTGEMLSDLEVWREGWGKTLVMDNETIRTSLSFQGVSFPVAVETDPQQEEWILSLFEEYEGEIHPHLEEWLIGLTYLLKEIWQ